MIRATSLLRRLLDRPLPPRVAVVQRELDRFPAPRYLELGVHTGVLFLHVRARSKLGVDPDPRVPALKRALHPNSALRGRLVRASSDEFFAGLDPAARFEVVFVDGLHLYEQCLRDVDGSLAHLADGGVVLVHDCNPADPLSAGRDPAATRGSGWSGDVWKAVAQLRAGRPELEVVTLDTDGGIGVIRRGGRRRATAELDVAALGYEDLERRRAELLGLRAP